MNHRRCGLMWNFDKIQRRTRRSGSANKLWFDVEFR